MSTRYKGSIMSATAAPTSTVAAYGIWKTSDQMQAKKAGLWPGYATTVSADYLVVAGGGSGGRETFSSGLGGGGGAGGLLTGTALTLNIGTTYTVTVGPGGTAPASGSVGNPGTASSIAGTGLTTISAVGGGGGGGGASVATVGNGGSGGGGGGISQAGGTGTAGPPIQGYDGGTATGNLGGATASGGGGGAGGAGGAGASGIGGAGGIGVYSTIAPGGTYSIAFSGTTQYITAPASASNVMSGDFTVECWIYPTSIPANTGIITITNAGGTGAAGTMIGITTTNAVQFFVTGNGGISTSANNVLNTSQWQHIALVRIGSTNTLYLNGTSVATNSITPAWNSTPTISIGRMYADNTIANFPGSISNVRITKGIGVYTGTFTPPTTVLATTQSSGTNIAAIPSTSYVILLTAQSATIVDNSTSAQALTLTGTPTVSSILTPSLTTTGIYYAGGGGGAVYSGSITGTGGSGLGGTGGIANGGAAATSGATNTGGGGGGGHNSTNPTPGAGGSGIVILRVNSAITAASTTGTPVVTTPSGYRIYTFTGSGSITF